MSDYDWIFGLTDLLALVAEQSDLISAIILLAACASESVVLPTAIATLYSLSIAVFLIECPFTNR